MPSNHPILCHPLLLQPSIFPNIRVFSNESALRIRWPKYWSFGFSISLSNEYSGLISFKIDWFDLLAVQGTLRIFSHTTVWKHQSFSTQLSLWSNSHIRTCMTAGKTIALTICGSLSAKWHLLFNTLSRVVITFLLRNNHLLISWLQSSSAVILEPKKRKSVVAPTFSLLFAMNWWGRVPWP